MAINFSDKVLVTNPTSYRLGQAIIGGGIIAIIIGIITCFTGDFLFPGLTWCAIGTPIVVVGLIVRATGLTKR